MIADLIAQAPAAPIPASLLPWITSFVVAVIGAVGAALAHRAGKAKAVSVKAPVPTITIREEDDWVTHEQLNEHIARIERNLEEIKDAMSNERGTARTAQGNIHRRIDSMSERMGERLAALDATSASIAQTVNKLLDIALDKKPGK